MRQIENEARDEFCGADDNVWEKGLDKIKFRY